MMPRVLKSSEDDLIDATHHIQAEAWQRIGVDTNDLKARFEARKQVYRDLASSRSITTVVTSAGSIARSAEAWLRPEPGAVQTMRRSLAIPATGDTRPSTP